jgi:hypothetical protein
MSENEIIFKSDYAREFKATAVTLTMDVSPDESYESSHETLLDAVGYMSVHGKFKHVIPGQSSSKIMTLSQLFDFVKSQFLDNAVCAKCGSFNLLDKPFNYVNLPQFSRIILQDMDLTMYSIILEKPKSMVFPGVCDCYKANTPRESRQKMTTFVFENTNLLEKFNKEMLFLFTNFFRLMDITSEDFRCAINQEELAENMRVIWRIFRDGANENFEFDEILDAWIHGLEGVNGIFEGDK